MSGQGKTAAILPFLLLVLLYLLTTTVWAKPVKERQAHGAVEKWLSLNPHPLGTVLGTKIKGVQAFKDAAGDILYFAVSLEPAGLVIVAGDDLVEPIVAFLSDGLYDPSPTNPLGALVSRDLTARVREVQALEEQGRPIAFSKKFAKARRKWGLLGSDTAAATEADLATVSEMRVAPLVQSKWGQGNIGSDYCFNYYTPNNYVCGCVATAMAQIMRYHRHPKVGVGTSPYQVKIDGLEQTLNLRGGDGQGAPYDWDNMVLCPKANMTVTERQAIGALTYDAGLSVNMNYTNTNSGTENLGGQALRNTFTYENAIDGGSPFQAGSITPDNLLSMINPNLDAGLPIILSMIVQDSNMGHAIVGDGYGYDTGTLYHHLNMGWLGLDDAWYNLPEVPTTKAVFNVVDGCVYNIYAIGSGEIISGRVTTHSGVPLAEAAITAVQDGGATYTATTNSQGIYAFSKLPVLKYFTIRAAKSGFLFKPQRCRTGSSQSFTSSSGNLWVIDFTPTSGSVPSLEILLLQ